MTHIVDHEGRIHPDGMPYERAARTTVLKSQAIENALQGDIPFIDIAITYDESDAWARLDNFREDETDSNFALTDVKVSRHRTHPESLESVEWEEIQELFRADRRVDQVVSVLDEFLMLSERPDPEAHPHRKALSVVLGTTAAVAVGVAGIEIWRYRSRKSDS